MNLTRWCCTWEGRRTAVVTGSPSGRLSFAHDGNRRGSDGTPSGRLLFAGAVSDRGNLCGTTSTGRLSLADAILADPRPSHADGRAALAALFDRLPGLTVAAVPIGAAGLLLGDHTGDTTLLGADAGELAAAAACLWLISGRRLPALAAVHRLERRACPVQRRPADLGEQLDRFGQVGTGPAALVVGLGDFGQRQQRLRLVHR